MKDERERYESARFTLALIPCRPGGRVREVAAPDPAVLRAAERRRAERSYGRECPG